MRNTIIFVLFLFLSSCEQDLEPSLPGFESKLVVHSFINPGIPITVFLTENVDILSTERPNHVTGSTITLYEDDVMIEVLEETSIEQENQGFVDMVSLDGVYQLNYHPKKGSEYRIEVENTNYPHVTAITEIPVQTSNFEITLSEPSNIDVYHEGIESQVWADYSADIKIADAQGPNYYSIALISESRGYQVGYINDELVECEVTEPGLFEMDFRSNSIIFEDGENSQFTDQGGLVFSDDLFENKEFEFRIEFRGQSSLIVCNGTEYFDSFHIQVRTLSKEYYEYIKTTTLQKAVLEDPFAEPVQIFSNIAGGLGIFGGYNFETIEFSMRELLDDIN